MSFFPTVCLSLHPSGVISEEPCIIWLSLMEQMCKVTVSPGFVGRTPTSICHFYHPFICPSVCCSPYPRNWASSDNNFRYTCVKWWCICFFNFFLNFYFLDCWWWWWCVCVGGGGGGGVCMEGGGRGGVKGKIIAQNER